MLRLYVDNKYELDINEIDVTLFKEILDKDNIASRSSSWTREITLPNTETNNNFFETIYKLDKETLSFKKGKRIKAILTNGSDILLEGFMQLINTKTSEGLTVYNVIFAGQLIDLMKKLDTINLSYLPLDEYDHERNWDTIRNSWTYKIRKNGYWKTSKEGYVYPDIIYQENNLDGDKYMFDYYPATHVKTIINKIFDISGFKYNSEFLESEYFNNLYLPFSKQQLNEQSSILNDRKVYKSHDYTLHNTTDEWNHITTPQKPNTPTYDAYWNNTLTLPYNLNYNNLTLFNDGSGVITPGTNTINLTDNLNQLTQDVYQCQNQGEYDINISIPMICRYYLTTSYDNDLEFRFTNGQLEYRWIIFLRRANGGLEILERNAQPVSGSNPLGLSYFSPSDTFIRNANEVPWYDYGTRLDILHSSKQFLNQGDEIYIQVHFKHTNTEWDISDGIGAISDDAVRAQLVTRRNISSSFAEWSVLPSSKKGYGYEQIKLQNTLPEVTCKEFLMSIIQMFNLVIDEDKTSTPEDPVFKIEPYDKFFMNGKIIDDWKLDNNSELKQEYNDGIKEYLLSYIQDDDYYNDNYYNTLKSNKIYGEFSLYTNDEMANEINELDLIFAPTINDSFRTNGRVVPYLCDIENDVFKPKQTKPRILFYNGPIECNRYNVLDTPTTPAISNESVYPYIGMWDHPFDPNNTLEFGYSTTNYYSTNALPKWNLFNKFHQNLRNKISNEYRIVTGWFYLTPKQINEFDFTNLIKVNNQLYRVLLIDGYNYGTEETLTKVIMEKIINTSFYEPNNRINGSACPSDLKLTRTSNGFKFFSPNGTITEQCCLERGGEWNEENGTCSITILSADNDYNISSDIPDTSGGSINAGETFEPSYPNTTSMSINDEQDTIITSSGVDEVYPISKTDNTYIISGGTDTVRQLSTDNSTFIVDGNDSELK